MNENKIADLVRAGKSLTKCLVKDLCYELERNNLSTVGKKIDLIKRVEAFYLGNELQSSTNCDEAPAHEKAIKLFSSNDSLSQLMVFELKDALSYWKLSKVGKKDELLERLYRHLASVAVSSQSIPNLPESKVVVFMVAEKPVMASQISKTFPNRSNISIRKNAADYKVYEFHGEFMGRSAHFKMTNTFGHLMRMEFASEYHNWHAYEPLQLFSCPIEKIECNPKAKIKKFLSDEAKNCDFALLWLDCDLEGENICFEVMDAIKKSMRKCGKTVDDQIFRAHFSSLDDVENALRNLVRPNRNQALAVDAKKELDLRIGVAFSRFQTMFFRERKYDVKLLSFGPCQTPTLAFCVKQHEKVVDFKAELYFSLTCKVNINGTTLNLDFESNSPLTKEECVEIMKKLKFQTNIKLKEIHPVRHEKKSPKPLNTVELLKVASSKFSFSPSETMHLAQNLYQRGYISYPRTETTAYPNNLSLRSTLLKSIRNEQLKQWSDGKLSIDKILNNNDGEISQTRKGEDKGDHPPIYPIRFCDNSLSKEESILFEYVCKHFVISLMGACCYETSTLIFTTANNEILKTQIRCILDEGFTNVVPDQCPSAEADELFKSIFVGLETSITDIKIVEKKSTSPTHLTEAELITKMEQYSIGTDASIPTHIGNISKYFVKLTDGRRLVPTPLGIALINAYRKLDAELIEPTVRATVERKLNRIACGEMDFVTVRDEILELYQKKFIEFTNNFHKTEHFFKDCFSLFDRTLLSKRKPQKLPTNDRGRIENWKFKSAHHIGHNGSNMHKRRYDEGKHTDYQSKKKRKFN